MIDKNHQKVTQKRNYRDAEGNCTAANSEDQEACAHFTFSNSSGVCLWISKTCRCNSFFADMARRAQSNA